MPIEFRHEPVLLETGGGIKNIEDSLGTEPFLVYSGDILTDVDLAPLIDEHFRRKNDVTLALRKTGLGEGVAAARWPVAAIRSKNEPPGDYDFADISIWNARFFERIPPATKISFIPILVDWIRQGGRIGGVVLNKNKWFNVGTRADYLEVHRLLASKSWRPTYVKDRAWPIAIAPDATVSPSAQLRRLLFHRIGLRRDDAATIENSDPLARCTNCFPKPSPQLYCPLPSHGTRLLHDLDI